MNTRDQKLEKYLSLAKKLILEIKAISVFSMYNPSIHVEAQSGEIYNETSLNQFSKHIKALEKYSFRIEDAWYKLKSNHK